MGQNNEGKTAYVLQHLLFEDLGILEPLLREHGYQIRFFEAGADLDAVNSAGASDVLIVLGGPIGVYEEDHYPFLRTEKRTIKQWIEAERPILGICLGAQLIAEALGAAVTPTGRKEIGFAPLGLTEAGARSVLAPLGDYGEEAAGAGGAVPVLHWHGDQFEIPEGAARLAETSGFPNQAFAAGPRILGLQFHLEADHRRIERWLVGHAVEIAGAGIDPGVIRRDAGRIGPQLAAAGREVFAGWLDAL